MRTLRYWVSRYRTKGLSGLVHRARSDSGKHRVKDELQELAKALVFRHPKYNATHVYEEVIELASREGWRPPSYRQVLSIIDDIDPQMLKLAHEGTEGHKKAYDLLVRFEATLPNERWQIDHKWLKIWVRDEGEPKKVCLTAVEDDYSRAIAGYYLHVDHPSSIRVALAVHQAILPKQDPRWRVCGVPEIMYNDNAPDFKSEHIEEVAAHLGARVEFSILYQPRGRGKIERFFRTVEGEFAPKMPGYAPETRPRTAKELLTVEQLDARFREWLLEVYHNRVHRETKERPIDRWEADGFFPNLPEAPEELDLLLLTISDTRKVQRDGILFKNGKYTDLTLGAYIGEDVMVRYDPRDSGEIRVYHENKFICRAVCWERAGESLSFKEIRKSNSRRRANLRGQLRNLGKTADVLLEDGNEAGASRGQKLGECEGQGKSAGEEGKLQETNAVIYLTHQTLFLDSL